MPESSPEPSRPPAEPGRTPSGAPLQEEHRVEPAAGTAEEVFALADDQPAAQPVAEGREPPAAEGAEGPAEWFFARPGGQREGPFSLAEMQRRVTSGQLQPGDLVWRRGMSDWTPVREVGALHGAGLGGEVPPPLPGRRPAPGVRLPSREIEGLLVGLDRFFARPLVYRVIGRVCAVLGVLVVLFSLALLWIHIHWFTGALVFGLIFVICEAAGAILEGQQRLAAQPRAAERPGEPRA